MDDVTTLAASWCDEALGLCDGPAIGGPRGNGQPAADGPEDVVLARLDAVAAGMKLRRKLDGLDPDEPTERVRRAVVGRLLELQRRAQEDLAQIRPGTARHREVAARTRQWLAEARISAQNVRTVLEFEPLHQSMAIEALRGDVEWLAAVIAWLDGERPPARSVWLDAELERLRGDLARPDGRHPDELDDSLFARCNALQAVLLERRVRRELDRPMRDADPQVLWSHRFALSRLQAHVASLGEMTTGELPSAALPSLQSSGLSDWAEALAHRRAELADAADGWMAEPGPRERLAACEQTVAEAFDEIGEMTAVLEQLPPPRAVRRLELTREDLERLADSCWQWAGDAIEEPEEPDAPAATAPPPPQPVSGDLPQARNEPAGPAVVTPPPAADPAALDEAARPRPAVDPLLPVEPVDPASPTDAEERALDREAAASLRKQARRVDRLAGRVRSEWREKLLTIRMDALLGRRGASMLENAVLVLIPVLVGLIAAEWLIERAGPLSVVQHQFFAWADLAVCSVLLAEVAVRMSLAPERGSYLVRHLLIDLIPSLPFGFIAHQIDLAEMTTPAGAAVVGSGALAWLASVGRLSQVLRTTRLILPVVRLARIALILLRLFDRLERRMAGLINRNIILFEPSSALRPESRDRHRLLALRSELEHARILVEERLAGEDRRRLTARLLGDLTDAVTRLPAPILMSSPAANQEADGSDALEAREVPVEAVVERLLQMTPEQLVDRMGPGFVQAVDRYLRLLDLPLVRRLPGIRSLVVFREKGPAESVALAANYLGGLIQRGLDVAYFLADLHGTLSPPVFLDRLGATIVNATRTPAKRLLYLGSAFLLLYVVLRALPFLTPFRIVVERISVSLGWPFVILGTICLGFWSLGAWFRRIANQSADFCERVVEAQFAAHTKGLKSRRRDEDARFLAERVIDPEVLLRSSDDRAATPYAPRADGAGPGTDGAAISRGRFLFENRELAFLRNVRLLYQDYLDGSPLHRSDTKASIQLLGNLALSNLRRSHLRHLLRESRMLDRLDLSRAGGLFGGPYLWFNYITRLLVQETAILILDYNRHAIPVDRLACSPAPVRERFRIWLAGRLKVEPEEIHLPEPVSSAAGPAGTLECRDVTAAGDAATRRTEADAFLETVEFTAVDFLSDDPDRDAEIRSRFGPQVAELVRRDRQQNVRRAFRSFPLHELPASSRTINPFALYENYIAGGRVVLLPLTVLGTAVRGVVFGIKSIRRVVREILHPRVDQDRTVPPDTYWAALRKIHRMRKPVFMGSLWLRARFDVEYLGLPLPTAPTDIAADSMMEADLDYIGATRQDRIIAEQVRRQHQARLEWVGRWLKRFGWTFEELPGYLAGEIPYLANRGGEALRAAVMACVLDHDDIATLALSIEALERVLAHASDPAVDHKTLPAGLPEPVLDLRSLWHPVHRVRVPLAALFDLPDFRHYDERQRRRIIDYLRRHRRTVRGWIRVVLCQGGRDPWETVRGRIREVLVRTDLWSDQILVLRAVQSLTMLDVQHNCELVWELGGYTAAADPQAVPGDPEPGHTAPSDLAEGVRHDDPGVPTIPFVEA